MSRFRGTPPIREMPGTYSVRRRVASVTYAAWAKVDFRTPGWMDACPAFAGNASLIEAARLRGEVRRVDVRLVSGTEVRIAHEASPSDRWNTADSNARVNRSDFPNWVGQSAIWLDSNGGAVVLEVEVAFDLPSAEDVS